MSGLEREEKDRVFTAHSGDEKTAPLLVITEILPNDILLGRGAPMIRNEGNARFREIVRTRKDAYMSSGRHHVKNEIAKQVLELISERHGRFLRRIDSQEEAETIGVPKGKQAWVLADDDAILEKVKQALRDKDPKGPSTTLQQPESSKSMEGLTSGGVAQIPHAVARGPVGLGAVNISHMTPLGSQQVANLQALDTVARLRRQDEIRRLQLSLLQHQQVQNMMRLQAVGQFHQPVVQSSLLTSLHGSDKTRTLYNTQGASASYATRAALQAFNRETNQRNVISALGLGYSNGSLGHEALASSHNDSTAHLPTSLVNSASKTDSSSTDKGKRSLNTKRSRRKQETDVSYPTNDSKKFRA